MSNRTQCTIEKISTANGSQIAKGSAAGANSLHIRFQQFWPKVNSITLNERCSLFLQQYAISEVLPGARGQCYLFENAAQFSSAS